MKKNVPALLFVLFIALNSVAQLNYERKQIFNFKDRLAGFALVDINKDSKPDLVFSYFDQDYLAFRLNESSKTKFPEVSFGAMTRMQLEKKSSKRALHICDINNDSFDDVLFSEYDNSRIGIAINNKQSQFRDIYYFQSGSKPAKILSADFNKDQLNDLALICEESKQVQVFLGNSSSKLTEPVSYSLSGTPSDMELKDVNNDGAMDIMVSDKDNNKLQLFTGNGDGTFTKGLTIATNANPANFEIADFDGDQLADVAVVVEGSSVVQVGYQRENHTFSMSNNINTTEPVSALDFIIEDLNSDGYLDMAIRNNSKPKVELLLGKSGNLFSNIQKDINSEGSYTMPLGFCMKPFYYPNKLTFLCINDCASNVYISGMNSDFTINYQQVSLIQATQRYYSFEMADMNGDHLKDLLLQCDAAKSAALYYAKSDQSYSYVKTIPFSIDYYKMLVSDINLDGYPDIIISGFYISEILLNDGNNNFKSTILHDPGYTGMAVMDVNNNGNPDLFINSNLYLDIKLMDFNHDQNPDIVATDWGNSSLTIYPSNGDGTFGTKISISILLSSTAIGDVNKDGYDDILGIAYDLGKVVLFRNNKNGGFTQEFISDKGSEFYSVYFLDLDKDSNKDIVFTSPMNVLKYLPVNPDGTIAAQKEYSNTLNGGYFMKLMDYDNDGNEDLFLLGDGQIERYSNKLKATMTLKNLIQRYDGFQVDDLVDKTIPAGLNTSIKFNGQVTRPKNAGTYKAQVSISDDLYKATIDTVLVVNKAPLQVKAVDKAKEYGTVNPAFKIEYSGFVSGEAADFIDQSPTVSCLADVNSPMGSYPIVVSGGLDNNYQLNYENGTLTIGKRKLTVKPDNAVRKYGEKDPVYSLSYTGFVNNETASVIDKAPVVKTLASSASPAGLYDLLASAGEDNNYEFEYQTGSLTIEKAPLTIKADYKTRKYGEENPKLTFTATGFAYNEGVEVIDQLPLASTTATKLSPVGSYDITLAGGMDNNYNLELQKGMLTIGKAFVQIKAEDQSKVYGQENPSFTLAATGFVNNESLEVINQLPLANTEATKFSSVGTYDIELSGGLDNNYDVEYLKGTLTIEKAPLTIKAEDKYKRRGEDNPDLTILATGFVNNEGIEVIDQRPVASTLAGKDSPAGNYTIDLSGGYDNNYDLMLVSGNLKIDYPQAVNQAFSSQVKIYPVPARETLCVENIGVNILALRIVDNTGSVVKTIKVTDHTRLSIPVSDLSPGVYFLETIGKDHPTKRYKLTII